MKCQAKKLDGTRCNAYAMRGSKYCFRHNKKVKKDALQASAEGGKAKRQYHNLGETMKLRSPKDIKNLMEKAINKLWMGEMPASNPAGSLGYLSKIFLEAYDKSELERRLEELEKRLDKLDRTKL